MNGVWTEPGDCFLLRRTRASLILNLPFQQTDPGSYFLSTRPDGDEAVGDQDIWYVERNGSGWSLPVNLGEPVNTDGGEFFPSLTRDGTLYFTRNAKAAD